MKEGKNCATLCWNCINAVPNDEKGTGCAWSKFFKPVKGWDAKKTIVHANETSTKKYGKEIPSYLVYQCPCFAEN